MEATIIGVGAVGSKVAHCLAAMGVSESLRLYDHDKIEDKNKAAQGWPYDHVGSFKVTSLRNLLRNTLEQRVVSVPEKFTADKDLHPVVFCCPDNMEARTAAFEAWKRIVGGAAESGRDCFFGDARMHAHSGRILAIPGNRPDLIEGYERTLFKDGDKSELAQCANQTNFYGGMVVAGMLVRQFNEWYRTRTVSQPDVVFDFGSWTIMFPNFGTGAQDNGKAGQWVEHSQTSRVLPGESQALYNCVSTS